MDRVQVPQEHHRDQIAEVLATSMNFPIERAKMRAPSYRLEDLRVALEGGRVVATAGEFRFRQWFGGEPLGCSGIWGVTTLPEHRSKGLATTCVESLLRAARDRGDPLTALFPAVLGPYRKLGYELAGAFLEHRLPLEALPSRRERALGVTLAEADRDVAGVRAAFREWVRPQSGPVEPSDDAFWRDRMFERAGVDSMRAVVVYEDDRITGFASFSREDDPGPLDVAFGLSCHMLFATTGPAWEALLSYFRGFRGLGKWLQWAGPPMDATALTALDTFVERPFRHDWMLRLLDVPTAFEGRGYPAVEATATLAVNDPLFPQNAGPWRIEVRDGTAKVSRADAGRRPVPIGALSAMFSGYLRAHDAVRLGYLDIGDPAVEGLGSMLAGPDPWCPFFF